MQHHYLRNTIFAGAVVVLLICSLLLPACSKSNAIQHKEAQAVDFTPVQWEKYPAPSPAPEVTPLTGKIDTGSAEILASKPIDQAGGTITVDKPGDPLNGLKLEIPSGAYDSSVSFKISSSPIVSHTFGADLNPLSPLITVENGGNYSEELMELTVPVNVPKGHFAMGFIYDDITGKLEGLPLVRSDAGSVTVATRHFSKTLISSIAETVLKEEVDSGFRPGIDDWQYPNEGSAIAPAGHCAGQSITAMWYYCEKPDGAKTRLWDTYDNYGHGDPTTDFWYDDSYAYRLASVVQKDLNWTGLERKLLIALAEQSDQAVWNMFSYAMRLTREPQYVGVSGSEGGHALIVYKIKDNALWVADPNYPSNPYRKIEYTNGKFKPYESGANAAEIAAGRSIRFDKIRYFAKTTLINWGNISKRWQQMKAKTIGDRIFPDYVLSIQEDPNSEWEDLKSDTIKTSHESIIIAPFDPDGNGLRYCLYRNGEKQRSPVSLVSGNNRIGILVVQDDGAYVDFKYVNVNFEGASPTPTPTPVKPSASQSGSRPVIQSLTGPTEMATEGEMVFTAVVSGGSKPYYYEWYGPGPRPILQGVDQNKYIALPGSGGFFPWNDAAWIKLKVKDASGHYAMWIDENGVSKDEFFIGIRYGGGSVTQPAKFPYKSAP